MGQGNVFRVIGAALLGVLALALVIAGFIATQSHQDIRPMVVIAYVGFFLAALVAPVGRGRAAWPAGLAVALGGILPALALSYFDLALTDHIFLTAYVLTTVTAVAVAIVLRRVGSRGRRGGAVAMGCLALLAALGAAYAVMPALLDRSAYAEVQRQVQPFSLRTLDGQTLSSQAWGGKVVVLSYWATWCPPCQAEAPEIAALQRKYAADPRVLILAVDAGYGGDTAEKAGAYLRRRGLAGPQAIDDLKPAGRQKGDAAVSLGLSVVPTLFILDKAGRLVVVHTGFDGAEHLVPSLSRRIDRLVAGA